MEEQTALRNFISNIDSNNQNFITKKLISDLINLAKIEDIEAGIVKYFLKKNKINNIKNKLINQIIQEDKQNKVLSYLTELDVPFSWSYVEKLFELLIKPEDKRINGAVPTPAFIVDYIVNNVIKSEGLCCDCSCGSGAFLLGILKRLQKLSKKKIKNIIEENIYGVDILEYSIRRAKIMLLLYAILNKEDTEEINFNLKIADSLKVDWKKIFPEVFEKHGGFDYVVGNPPYVRIQDLSKESREDLLIRWESIGQGNFNLYFAFFELGMTLLKKDSRLGYITPNNYFTSLAGIELRNYFNKNKEITKILNFNHLRIFENASTYTCITFMEKNQKKDHFEYHYIKNKNELKNLNNLNFSHYFYNWLDNKKWRLMSEDDYYNIKTIETIGTSLGKLYPIRVGIATLKDPVYFVKNFDNKFCTTNFRGKTFLIEREITRKIIKIPSIKSEEEIKNDNRRIIFPYTKINGKYGVTPEKDFSQKFPKCYSYLLLVKDELAKRDKGKKSYPSWYAWGRTQGMDFKGKRLYTRTFYHKPDFMLDEEEENLFCNGYAVFCKQRVKAIQKILNSKIMGYYVKNTSVEIEGNYQCYQKNFIEKFNIPTFSEDEWMFLEKETDKNKIDPWLIKKYNLKNID